MTAKKYLSILAAPVLAIGALSGCSTGFNANVARFQQLPPVQGQTFTVVADDPNKAGGLEFQHYADLVAQRLTQYGYTRAAGPDAAQLVVRLDYGVDRGREKVRSDFNPDPFWGGAWGYPGYYGLRGRYVYGFHDPFLWGGYNSVSSYTVYDSMLKMRIDQAGSGRNLFDGTARAQSLSNKLTYIVPNLVDAIFSGFPGNSGEDIRVTVAPETNRR